MNEIIIVADLGHMKILRIMKDPLGLESPKVELIKSLSFIETHSKPSDKFSDAAGRFYMGSGKRGTAAGFGEPHHVESEVEKRLIKQVAEEINALIIQENCDRWHLSADRSINSQIIEKLDPSTIAKLKKNITANLIKSPKAKVLSHFA
jgi:Protein required for attachment to host cells